MSISYDPGMGKPAWNEQIIETKLVNLAGAQKSKQWICKDLSTPNSSAVGRFMWSAVAKRCDCMRSAFYNVNLNTSSDVLKGLDKEIPATSRLARLFDLAVGNYEAITLRRLGLTQKVFFETAGGVEAPPATQSPKRAPVAVQPAPAEPVVQTPVIVEPAPVVVEQPVVYQEPVIVGVPPSTYFEPAPVIVPVPVAPAYPLQHRFHNWFHRPTPVFARPAPVIVPRATPVIVGNRPPPQVIRPIVPTLSRPSVVVPSRPAPAPVFSRPSVAAPSRPAVSSRPSIPNSSRPIFSSSSRPSSFSSSSSSIRPSFGGGFSSRPSGFSGGGGLRVPVGIRR